MIHGADGNSIAEDQEAASAVLSYRDQLAGCTVRQYRNSGSSALLSVAVSVTKSGAPGS